MSEVERNIKKFSKKLDLDITKALAKTGEIGVGVIKRNTPVESGRLRNSMSYSIASRVVAPESPFRQNDVLKPNKSKKEVVIGTNVIYAPNVEFNATNGSQGYFNRGFNQFKKIAKKVFANSLKGMIE